MGAPWWYTLHPPISVEADYVTYPSKVSVLGEIDMLTSGRCIYWKRWTLRSVASTHFLQVTSTQVSQSPQNNYGVNEWEVIYKTEMSFALTGWVHWHIKYHQLVILTKFIDLQYIYYSWLFCFGDSTFVSERFSE